MSPSFEISFESMQERGRMACKLETVRRMGILRLRRLGVTFGASKTYGGRSDWQPDSHLLHAYLIDDVDEGQSILVLQQQCGVHIFLRCQHLGERVLVLPGFYVEGGMLDR